MNALAFFKALSVFSASLAAQMISSPIAAVRIGSDGLVHVLREDGREISVAKAVGQVGVSSPLVSVDKQWAGWMVLQENCCTSYPIATSVGIYSGKQVLYLRDEKMVVAWCFVPGKPQVAVATETVHGWTSAVPDSKLYSVGSGNLLQRWTGEADAAMPNWALCLKQSRPELFE